ncbi:MAG TPA: LacI family DNA-binding transcriptional regulator, partial [Chloroflexota bacterium]|nr:LacI family DNA-binding transcriptional regulator [Chloroflexota bacterium]
MATMIDVARAAGVSIQTISAVINDKSGISEATRERVRRVIEELDYHPNQLASSLRSQRTRTIGILVPSITNPYWPEMVRGAEDVAHLNGYAVFLCNTDGDREKQRA